MFEWFITATSWLNANQGVVSIAIFAATLLLGWLSGIFSSLRRKPRFNVRLLEGPTFCCTYNVGKECNGFPVHRTGLCLYLAIANRGSAAASIEDIAVGYRWPLKPYSLLWFKYSVGRFWLTDQAVALEDFQVAIGEKIKIFPFLTQRSSLVDGVSTTYLGVGQSTNGVVYFEQNDSWGGCFPAVDHDDKVNVKIKITDTFGKTHS